MTTKVRHDANTGQGYGLTKARLHFPRQMGSVYPYIEIDEDLEEFEDQETEQAISKNVINHMKTDFYAFKEPFYYVAGNTKLADCFDRPEKILKEIKRLEEVLTTSTLTKKPKKHATLGPSFPQGVGNFKRTGSKRGYFSSPPKVQIDIETIPNYEDEDDPIDNLKDLARKQDITKGNFSV